MKARGSIGSGPKAIADRDQERVRCAAGIPAGEKYQYSNLGYFVLSGDCGQRVRTIMAGLRPGTNLFSTRVMNASGVVDTALVVPHRVNGYVYRNGKYQKRPRPLLALRPSGAFRSSLNDMVKWDAALTNATILPQQMLYAMWTPVVLRDGSRYPYGFGFQIGIVMAPIVRYRMAVRSMVFETRTCGFQTTS
jgi:CubicO group peptidase (beta-lactamase class C family)